MKKTRDLEAARLAARRPLGADATTAAERYGARPGAADRGLATELEALRLGDQVRLEGGATVAHTRWLSPVTGEPHDTFTVRYHGHAHHLKDARAAARAVEFLTGVPNHPAIASQ